MNIKDVILQYNILDYTLHHCFKNDQSKIYMFIDNNIIYNVLQGPITFFLFTTIEIYLRVLGKSRYGCDWNKSLLELSLCAAQCLGTVISSAWRVRESSTWTRTIECNIARPYKAWDIVQYQSKTDHQKTCALGYSVVYPHQLLPCPVSCIYSIVSEICPWRCAINECIEEKI